MPGAKRDPEPVLPELARSAWRRAGTRSRAILVAAVAIAIVAAAWLAFGRGGGSFAYAGPEAPSFSISWGGELQRVETIQLAEPGAGGAGFLLALSSGHGELTIDPFEFEPAAGTGELLPALSLVAAEEAEALRQRHPGARVALEGRTELAVDRGPEAYQLAYTAPAGPEAILIGKLLLVPDPDRPGHGVAIEITERASDPRVIEKVREAPAGFFLNWPIQLLLEDAASVRTAEGLEEPLRSFEFG